MSTGFTILAGLSIFCLTLALFSALEARRQRLVAKLSRELESASKIESEKERNLEEEVFGALFWISVVIVLGVFLGLPMPMVALLGAGAAVIRIFLISRRREWREQALERQLEGALLDMTAVLWTNPSLKEAIMAAQDGVQGPLREELDVVLREIDCGEGIDQALLSLKVRHKSSALKMAVSAMIICRETGGNLAQVLERAASLIRMRLLLKSEITALTSQQKTTAIAISLMPIGFLLLTQILNPGYLNYLFTPMGTFLLLYAVVSMGVGFYVLQKMSDLLPRGK